ncbi:MAG: ABC transporter ATP-binding protein [Bdellovibrionota bacterium]
MSSKSESKVSYLWRLLALAKPHWKVLTIATLALAGGSAVNLAIPEIIRRILNDSATQLVVEHPLPVAFFLFGLFLLQANFFYIRSLLFMTTGQKVVAKLREDLYKAIIGKEIDFFDSSRTGDLVSRLNSDCSLIQDAVSIKISVIIRYGLQVIAGVILMTLISLKLTFALLVIIPLLVGLSVLLGKRLRSHSRNLQAELGNSTVIAEETFSGIRVVKAFLQELTEFKRYSESINKVLNIGIRRSKLSAFFSSFAGFLMNISVVGVLIYGASLVAANSLTAGDLTAFMLYGVIVAISFAFIAGGYSELLQALGASERVFELLDEQSTEINTTRYDTLLIKDKIEFKSVSFSYPSRPDRFVINDISFKINANTKTALVGPSGSGKSTIVSLLLKLYEASNGEILVDGKDIKSIDAKSLRSAIAIVPQDPQLFAVSIEENLRYGNQAASQEELEKACEQANILDFIISLPNKFKTHVGDRGVQLSGGEKQRIAIARAILKKPSLLILDEATSALDSQNEFVVQDAIDKLSFNVTTLVIAHRLSTVKSADKVLVLDSGSLVQTGTHQDLASKDGLYKSLVDRQELFKDMA